MAEIISDRTWCRFIDDAGVEWVVNDQWPRYQFERYPGEPRAIERIFRRFTPLYGSQAQQLVEERRYRFDEDDSRWLEPHLFQLQLNLSNAEPTP